MRQQGQHAQRLEPVRAGGFGGNEQGGRQAPKQRGKSARQFAKRAEQLRIGRGFVHQKLKYVYPFNPRS